MNGERREEAEQLCCYFHPRDLVVEVCASCLKERLSVLASIQKKADKRRNYKVFPSIFTLSSLINPLDIKFKKFEVCYDGTCSSTSREEEEDSFISIKFEDNGVASWDKGALGNKAKSVVAEHPKHRTPMRWRKRIGRLLHVIGINMCHGGTELESSNVKHGWIRILTKRRDQRINK